MAHRSQRDLDGEGEGEDEECNLKSDYELLLCYIIIQNSALTVRVPPLEISFGGYTPPGILGVIRSILLQY